MIIREDQILDIKCTLADIKKKDLALQLGVNPVDLSRTITNNNFKNRINDFFDNINPEINFICKKIQGTEGLDVVSEPPAKYLNTPKQEIDKLKLELARERKNVDLLQRFSDKIMKENDEYMEEILMYRAQNKQKPTGSY